MPTIIYTSYVCRILQYFQYFPLPSRVFSSEPVTALMKGGYFELTVTESKVLSKNRNENFEG